MSKDDELAAQIKAFWKFALFLMVVLNTVMAGFFLIVLPLMWVAGDAEVVPAVALITAAVFNVWLLLTLAATYLHMRLSNRPEPNPEPPLAAESRA